MNNLLQTLLSVLTLLGVGGLVGGYVTYVLDRKKEREFKVLEQREKRYKSCLLFMDACFEPRNIKYLKSRHVDIDDARDVMEYLKMEYHEMILYASNAVVLSVKRFIEKPTRENFLATILSMRDDLSLGKHDLELEKITLTVHE
jgi:hypothetical protein